MGLSSSKSKTTSTSNESSTATTTPVLPGWINESAQDWGRQVSAFGKTDPYALVAGPSSLQGQAFNYASDLVNGGASTAANQFALQTAQNVARAPANMATAQGYNPTPALAQHYTPAMATVSQYMAPSLGPADGYTAQGYNPALNNAPALAGAQGYNAQQAGRVDLGQATGYQGQGYSAAQASAAQIAAIERAQAERAQAASMLDNFSAYKNPATESLVNATMASFDDQAGRTAAAQRAAAARNGAFAGSRYGIEAAQLSAQTDLNRNLQEAGLRDRAFSQAVGMAQFDAGNRQAASSLNAQLGTNVSLANAGAENNRLSQNAQMATNASIANAGFDNSARAFSADALNRGNEFTAAARNNFALTQGQFDNARNLFNAEAGNRAAEFGASALNQAGLFNAGQQNTNAWNNQNAFNRASEFGADARNTAGQFNSAQRNQFALTQAGMNADASRFNAGARNQFALTNADALNQAGQFNTGASNQFALTNAAAQNAAGQFNANAFNDLGRFNAGQMDNAYSRQLAAAGLTGQLASQQDANNRANIGMMADLGAQQQALEQLRVSAPAAFMQLMAQLQNSQNFDLFRGSTTSGTSNSSGTNVTKSTPSMYSIFSDMASRAAAAAAASDRRLKKDIEKVGTHEGLGLYAYRYNWESGPKRIGVMADEVARLRPDALGPAMMDGYKTVNYAKLGLAHLVEA